MNSIGLAKIIQQKLNQAFSPDFLQLIDQTHRHQEHPQFQVGKSHFKLIIHSKKLSSLSKLKAHQAIYHCLAEFMQTDIHALSITIVKQNYGKCLNSN